MYSQTFSLQENQPFQGSEDDPEFQAKLDNLLDTHRPKTQCRSEQL